MTTQTERYEWVEVNGIKVRLSKKGQGKPVLVLHDTEGWDEWSDYLEALSKDREVWYPEHPGYGKSDADEMMDSVDDLSFYYLDFIEEFKLNDLTVIGLGLGGWIAAEMVVKNDHHLKKLVLVNPFGIKVSPPETLDYKDTFTREWDEKLSLEWHNPAKAQNFYPNPKELDEERLGIFLRNQETTVHYTWSPYLHNSKLYHRLHRIHSEVVVIWGGSDKVVNIECGQAYANKTNGTFHLIEKAGHFPYHERPEAFIQLLRKEVL